MELRHLRYFVAVAEEEHYGHAARRLRVAQPALSRQIQDLEEEIGFELFDRLPRGVKISAAGKSLLSDVRQILQEANEGIILAKRIALGQSGSLKLGYVQTLSWHGIVPEALIHFRERFPDVDLQLRPLNSVEQISAVQSGSLDAGIIYTMADNIGELTQLRLGTVDLLLAIPRSHPFARRSAVRLRDLVNEQFVMFPRKASPVFFDCLMAECSRRGLTAPKIVHESVDEAATLSLIACGSGVAFLSSSTRWRLPPGVELLRITDLKLQLPFKLIWREGNRSPLIASFTRAVRSLIVQGDRGK